MGAMWALAAPDHRYADNWLVREHDYVDSDLRALYDSATYVRGAPHEAIDRLRRISPVAWVPEPALHGSPPGDGYWAVLSHRETKQVLRDAATFSSNLGGTQLRTPANPDDLAFVRQMMLNQDPPAHNRLRGLLSKAFIPRAIAALDAEITAKAHALVMAVAGHGECDLVTDVVGDILSDDALVTYLDGATVLTDDFAPVDQLLLGAR